jgi:hypothetical protein
MEHLSGLSDAIFVARAGNGIIYYRDDSPALTIGALETAGAVLCHRLKDAYDPNHILPELRYEN